MQQAYSRLPHLKITELLLEVDNWTGFTQHFTHLKSGAAAGERQLLLTTILADAINLGLAKMAESCPDATYAKLTWLQAWHIRDETYAAALAELTNAQFRQPFAAYWGEGTTSSSDGQNFKAGGQAQFAGHVNLKYGQEPGVQFYIHISDQYAPFHTKVINATVRDATHVLDGLLYHESDLRIAEHYTDTAGFTDHVFALMQLLGFRFAPRIRDLADRRLYVPGDAKQYPTLAGMIGGRINVRHIRSHWDEILRLATSIKQGTVSASLMLRKLGSYPRQNGLAIALRELGHIERTLFVALVRESRAPAACHPRTQQGRSEELALPSRGLLPPWSFPGSWARKPGQPRSRPQPRHRRHHPVQLPLSGSRRRGDAPARNGIR